ncbi:MAG: DUF29 domain-containing protein [Cyanobacteriota bacterium]|nr:DUF29 domain-containing protein [Cyanobacteriota bacterium]
MTETMTETIVKSLYSTDFFLWTQATVIHLKNEDFSQLDIKNLIEEVESLGKSEKKELKSRLTVLLEHLLKRIYVNRPDCYNGWENTISAQRTELELLFIDSPSLKSLWEEAFHITYPLALRNVRKSYKNNSFPDDWPYEDDIDAILNADFWQQPEIPSKSVIHG